MEEKSQLNDDVMIPIVKHLQSSRLHTTLMRSICSKWRRLFNPFSISLNPFIKSLPSTLKLPYADDISDYSLTESTIYFVRRSNEDSNLELNWSNPNGWFIRVEESENGTLNLLNIYSRNLTVKTLETLPNPLNLLDHQVSEIVKVYSLKFIGTKSNFPARHQRNYPFFEMERIPPRMSLRVYPCTRMVVSSNPWIDDSFAAMTIIGKRLYFIILKEGAEWKRIRRRVKFDYVVYHGNKFYAVDNSGKTRAFGTDMIARKIAPSLPVSLYSYLVQDMVAIETINKLKRISAYPPLFRLMVSCGSLFLLRIYDEVSDLLPHYMDVFKLDEEKSEWIQVADIGGQVFVFGLDCSFSISSRDFEGLKGDCIVFLKAIEFIYEAGEVFIVGAEPAMFNLADDKLEDELPNYLEISLAGGLPIRDIFN